MRSRHSDARRSGCGARWRGCRPTTASARVRPCYAFNMCFFFNQLHRALQFGRAHLEQRCLPISGGGLLDASSWACEAVRGARTLYLSAGGRALTPVCDTHCVEPFAAACPRRLCTSACGFARLAPRPRCRRRSLSHAAPVTGPPVRRLAWAESLALVALQTRARALASTSGEGGGA